MSLLSRVSGNDVDVCGMKGDRIRTSTEHLLISGRGEPVSIVFDARSSKAFEACKGNSVARVLPVGLHILEAIVKSRYFAW